MIELKQLRTQNNEGGRVIELACQAASQETFTRFVKLKIGISHILPAYCFVDSLRQSALHETSIVWEVQESDIPTHLRLARVALEVMGLQYVEKPPGRRQERRPRSSKKE